MPLCLSMVVYNLSIVNDGFNGKPHCLFNEAMQAKCGIESYTNEMKQFSDYYVKRPISVICWYLWYSVNQWQYISDMSIVCVACGMKWETQIWKYSIEMKWRREALNDTVILNDSGWSLSISKCS
jgi:hypothetical protein